MLPSVVFSKIKTVSCSHDTDIFYTDRSVNFEQFRLFILKKMFMETIVVLNILKIFAVLFEHSFYIFVFIRVLKESM